MSAAILSTPTSRSARWHMALFGAMLGLPVFAFAGLMLWQYAQAERLRVESRAAEAARTVAVAIDRELTGLTAGAQVLSLSRALQSDDLAAFYDQAQKVVQLLGVSPVLRTPDGRQLVNTRRPFGEALPDLALPVDAQAIATRQPQVSDLFVGRLSGEKLFSIVMPVVRGNDVPYTLAVSIPVTRLNVMLGQMDLPQTWTLAVVDRSGTIIARNTRADEFVGKRATEDLLNSTSGKEGTWNGTTIDGQAVIGAYSRTRLGDWRVAVGVKRSELEESFRRSLFLLAGLGVGIFVLSALLASLFGRRITAPLRMLSASAASLGRGEEVRPLKTSLAEVNTVGAELAEASTRLRERERSIQRGQDRFRAAVNAVRGVLWTNDASGRMTGEQPGWAALTGQSREEYEGYGWADAVHPDDREASVAAWNEAVEQRKTFVHEHRVRRRDAVWRSFAIRAVPVLDPDGTIREWVGVHTDITEQRDAEAELKESNEEIQRYAYIVSHDLRAPLVNIMGFTSELEAVRDEIRTEIADKAKADTIDKDLAESLSFIKAAINKMDGLINAILKLSREGRRTFRPEHLEMTPLLSGLADSLRHQTDSQGATVTVKDLPPLVADRLAVEQIFGNLVDNALKYLAPGRPGHIVVSGERIGSRVRYTVTDNGRGVAEKDHKRIFELFRRSGVQDRPGEGIGLAHVRTLVRTLGGRIDVSSTLGEGTVFTVTLPAEPMRAAPSQLAAE
jgi:PAS domain S-box-containing protein